MRLLISGIIAAAFISTVAQAGSQSSNTSSNSSSNNGITRERIVDSYCEDGFCERIVERRFYRDDRQRRRYRDSDRHRYREGRQWREDRYYDRRDRHDDDD